MFFVLRKSEHKEKVLSSYVTICVEMVAFYFGYSYGYNAEYLDRTMTLGLSS